MLFQVRISASLEKDMCKCFIRGLKPEIEQRIVRDLHCNGADFLSASPGLPPAGQLGRRQGSGGGEGKEIATLVLKN